jgi:Tol biopolymer transport system component
MVDRAGARRPLNIPAGRYAQPRISPNGKQLALHSIAGDERTVWIYDLTGDTSMRRLTFEGAINDKPTWTPDGQRVVFRSNREGDSGLFWQRADGRTPAERLAKAAEEVTDMQSEAWSPDGKVLIVSVSGSRNSATNRSLSILDVGADPKPKPLVGAWSSNSSFSPDGRWLAYTANDGRLDEVYVQPFPLTGAKYLVSAGNSPVWSPDGKQLFYLGTERNAAQIISVDVQTQPSFGVRNAMPLPIEGVTAFGPRPYDITPDGKSFVVIFPNPRPIPDKVPPEQINVTLNWFEELLRRVPTK